MQLNKDIEHRDNLIFGTYEPSKYSGGIRRFEQLDRAKIIELVANKFIDLDDRQNSSPSALEFFKFICDNQGYLAHGYAVTDKRDDYRVTIEGLEKNSDEISAEERVRFVMAFRDADDLVAENNQLYCWYD